jgi:hypothetical protein
MFSNIRQRREIRFQMRRNIEVEQSFIGRLNFISESCRTKKLQIYFSIKLKDVHLNIQIRRERRLLTVESRLGSFDLT